MSVGDQPICSGYEVRQIDPVWLFGSVSKGFWSKKRNRRGYLLWLGHKLKYRYMRDWYRLTYRDIADHRGGGLANVFWHGSPICAVKECFPDYDWQEWFFSQVPKTYWRDKKNLLRYMTWLGKQLGFQRQTDWYHATTDDFQKYRGGALLLEYRSSLSELVADCFPDRDWNPWMFERAPNRFWKDRKTCRQYLKWLGERLGLKKLDDWYGVKGEDFKNNYGRMLLRAYRSSVAEVVTNLIPRRQWYEWKFTRVPPGFWKNPENRRRYVLWLGKRLGFRQTEDWRGVCREDFSANYGGGLLAMYHSQWELLQECFPHKKECFDGRQRVER